VNRTALSNSRIRSQAPRLLRSLTLLLLATSPALAELRIPASTAYSLPDAEGIRISGRGVRDWRDSRQSFNWYGQFKTNGTFTARLTIQPPRETDSTLQVTIEGTSRKVTVPAGR